MAEWGDGTRSAVLGLGIGVGLGIGLTLGLHYGQHAQQLAVFAERERANQRCVAER